MLAPVSGSAAAEVEDLDGGAADAARGEDEAPEGVERRAAAGEHDGARRHRGQGAGQARGVEPHREGQRAQAARGAARARAPGRAARRRRRRRSRRRRRRPRGAWRAARRAGRPRASRWPSARRSRTRARAPRRVLVAQGLDGGQQDLLDRALDGADGEALLQHAVGLDLVEAPEGRRAGARASTGRVPRCAGHRTTAEDTFCVSSKAARSASICAEVELPVPARRAVGLGEAEAALPGAQGARADAQHGGGGVRADDPHAGGIELW